MAEQAHAARARSREADRELKQCGLAGAVGPDECRHRTGRNLEGAVAQCPLRAVALAKAGGFEGGVLSHAALEAVGGRTVSAKSAAMFSSSRPAARARPTQR